MLILARKNNESIIIGEDIRITVVEIKGETVRLGIDAPASIKILREELYVEVGEENVKAGIAAKVDKDVLEGLDKFLG